MTTPIYAQLVQERSDPLVEYDVRRYVEVDDELWAVSALDESVGPLAAVAAAGVWVSVLGLGVLAARRAWRMLS